MSSSYNSDAPARHDIDALAGVTLLEFGTDWCGHCRMAQPIIAAAIAKQSELRHLKVEDGKGRPLGRSFGVKLWPTLICLRDGQEVGRLVRPASGAAVQELLARAGK
ncbi:thioredoxin family protein [Haliea sp. E1-2-M8]|uniref:thioredoxin family protein n=1 Tax=Haliea sp. E1-2-M8 TaxID=3064706 RepID=UPI002727EAB3|nr:thioredoxin family protein [Haliea sp. E1-2-M8]MDO8862453.1 thioredoxin family protein [Haliea sp. E1-2-M8]